ncbi:MAG: ComEC/Rec2 family competence protein [Alphaproteobacteria bacterium]
MAMGMAAPGMRTGLRQRLAGFTLAAIWPGVRDNFLADRSRWALWLPVLLAMGIGIYFALPIEPPPFAGIGAAGLLAAGIYFCRALPGVQLVLIALFLAAAGFSAVQWRSASRETPLIASRLGPVDISGQLIALERQDDGVRYLIAPDHIDRLRPEQIPARIRLRLSGRARADPNLNAGDNVQLRAVLMPPPGPVTPGGFDYGRMLWFERIGAVGFIISPPYPVDTAQQDNFLLAAELRLTALRDRLTARVIAGIPGDAGVLAAALMTGDRAAISDPVNTAMKNSGLAHLISISGLHMGLVAGILFFSLRAALALIEPVALRYPIKKWSAAFAMTGLFLYLLISGYSIPTQRSFLMTGLILAAVMLDRTAISMRSIMLAASVILLAAPESLHSASFQMSFAAVIALVALYEKYSAQLSYSMGEDGWLRRCAKYVSAMLASSFVAGLATAPFAAFHFNRFTVYGLLANMLAVPLTGAVIMPCAVAAFMLMPFGLERLALLPMGWGVQWVIAIAYWVESIPGAVMAVGQAPDAVLLLIAGGGLWLCLWEQGWRRAGFVLIIAGVIIWGMGASLRLDILIEGEGRLIAVRNATGVLVVNSATAARHAGEEWAKQEGLMGRLAAVRDDPSAACDALGCMFTGPDSETVAFVRDANALEEDCAIAGIVIASVAVKNCKGPRLVIDARDLYSGGSHAVWLTPDSIRVETVTGRRGQRPWVPVRE